MISPSPQFPPLVNDALTIIHEKYPFLYGSADLAEQLEVSSPHLIRCFKKAVGDSPTNYLISYKLDMSKQLLLQENIYVDTVANLVGFSCGNYYAKVFKKHFSMTPSEYISQNQDKRTEMLEDFPQLYL